MHEKHGQIILNSDLNKKCGRAPSIWPLLQASMAPPSPQISCKNGVAKALGLNAPLADILALNEHFNFLIYLQYKLFFGE